MELYILSKQDLSILSICKLADYQINLDEETNAKSTFTLMKTNGLKKENYMVLNGLYRQFIFVIDDVQTEKGSNVVTVTALDISNIFNRKVIEKNIDTMKSKSIEEFLANTISENFVNSDDTVLNVNYIEIYWHTNTQGNVATNAENGLYNFHTFLINCRQYKNIYTDFKLENLGNPQTVEGKRISVEAKNRKIVDIMLEGESQQATRSGKNLFDSSQIVNVSDYIVANGTGIKIIKTTNGRISPLYNISLKANTEYTISCNLTSTTTYPTMYCQWRTNDGSTLWVPNLSNGSTTFTPSKDIVGVIFYLQNTDTDGTYVELTNLQIEKGSTATDYEPYGASPSPDYPSPIKNVEGKNIWNKSEISEKTQTVDMNVGELNVKDVPIPFTFSSYLISNALTNTNVRVSFIDSNNSNIGAVKFGNTVTSTNKRSSITINEIPEGAVKIRFDIRMQDGGHTEKTQLEAGTVATPYVPYNSLEFKDEGENLYNDNIDDYIKPIDYWICPVALEQGETYKLSGRLKGTKMTGCVVAVVPYGNSYSEFKDVITFYTALNTAGGVSNRTITVDSSFTSPKLVIYAKNKEIFKSLFENYEIQLNKNTVAKPYEPYKQQTEYFPLSEGQKLMEGSYLADDGIHHNFKEGLANGTSTTFEDAKENGKFYCNQKASGNLEGKTIAFDTEVTDAIVQYELAEEEIVPYTTAQQEAWDNIKNLTLFEGVNHISSDANMVLKYYPLEAVGLKFVLRIDIENKQETTKLIDTTLPEVTDYNKVYEEDVTAKVTAYIRENNTEYNLYLKTDRTTTTNKNDPDRASGKIEVISVDTVENAPEEALNVMKGNNYKHLVEFKIAKTSKLMDITELHIGRPIRIKTDDDIYDSYISAITLSDENFVYFKSGSLRITLLDKLKKTSNTVRR